MSTWSFQEPQYPRNLSRASCAVKDVGDPMKIILIRKGIDSGALSGKMASPILPCGCLCSIPIPYRVGKSYSEIHFGTRSVEQIVRELNPRWSNELAHLDPDLREVPSSSAGLTECRSPGRWTRSHCIASKMWVSATSLYFLDGSGEHLN
jgi:hypothetical protein